MRYLVSGFLGFVVCSILSPQTAPEWVAAILVAVTVGLGVSVIADAMERY